MEQRGPEQPQICPVCGSAKIKPSFRQNTSQADELISGILGYRCENGHVSIAAALHL